MFKSKKDRIINHICLTLFTLPSLYLLDTNDRWFGLLWFVLVVIILNKFYQWHYELEDEKSKMR